LRKKIVMNLEDSVRKWLDDQGYPLEMKVAEALRNAGIGWDHGRVYEDRSTEKVREIDVMGYLDYWGSPRFSIHLIMECKHAHGRPWVLFCTERTMLTPLGYAISLPCTKGAKKIMAVMAPIEAVQQMELFRQPDLVGFNFVRAHTDNRDVAFDAVRGVVTAALSTAAKIGKWKHNVLYVPIIVVDSPLMQCHLPANAGELALQEVQEGSLLYNPGGKFGHVVVRVIHINALPAFLEKVKEEGVKLYDDIRLKISEVDEGRGALRDLMIER
jgi:hypothetical protein